MKNAHRLIVLVALMIAALSSTAFATQGVSPGAMERFAQVEQRCPTFSWEAEVGAALYEIVAYAIHEKADPATSELTAETQALYSQISGAATSWTPSAEQCFAPGGRYVWFVRAVHELAGDEVIEAGEWSEGRYFTLPAGPTAVEVARAVEVLRRWEAANGGEAFPLATAADPAADPAAFPVPAAVSGAGSGAGAGGGASRREGEGEDQLKSVTTSPAAIRGHHPLLNGIAYGVVGTTTAAGGAGIGAAHLEGGADLILDGSMDGETDTRFWEGGLDRPSPDNEIFWVRNSGAGDIALAVEGTLAATALVCSDCVTSNAIADETITEADLASGAVTTSKIGQGAVTGAKILDGAVGTADLAASSVSSSKIAPGAVNSEAIHGNVISTGHIVNGTITAADIDPTSSIYVSKAQLYEREDATTWAVGGTMGVASAACDDGNDLALDGWCETTYSSNCDTWHSKADHWGTVGTAASFTCAAYNGAGNSCTVRARILCITVPGS